MASMWRKAMVYLGLGPDEEYDDYDPGDDPAMRRPVRARPEAALGRAARPGEVRPLERRGGHGDAGLGRRGVAPEEEVDPDRRAAVRTLPPTRDTRPIEDPRPARPSAVRPVSASAAAKPFVVSPGSFNDVQEVADRFKSSQPVIVNLQGTPRDLSRRLIDFASGLCYGLGGQMERVADQVYLLTPTDVEVSAEERRRLQERGLVDS